jgi:hypothetical protein
VKTKKRPPTVPRWASEQQHRSWQGAKAVPNEKYTPIWAGSRIVGEVRGDVFLKRVKPSVHFLKKPPAIAFDISSLHQAQQAGARWVRVIDSEGGKIYQAPLSMVFSKGFQFNRGYGDQIGLGLEHFANGDDLLAEQLGFLR